MPEGRPYHLSHTTQANEARITLIQPTQAARCVMDIREKRRYRSLSASPPVRSTRRQSVRRQSFTEATQICGAGGFLTSSRTADPTDTMPDRSRRIGGQK